MSAIAALVVVEVPAAEVLRRLPIMNDNWPLSGHSTYLAEVTASGPQCSLGDVPKILIALHQGPQPG